MTDAMAHADLDIERRLRTSPRHAFRFWSDKELKARWNDCHTDWTVLEDDFDFRVGGTEHKRWRTAEGQDLTFTAHYLDIVAAERIIYAYQMTFAGTRLSASLVSVAFTPQPPGTRMVFAERVILLQGGAEARQQRLAGTEEGMDRLVGLIDAGI